MPFVKSFHDGIGYRIKVFDYVYPTGWKGDSAKKISEDLVKRIERRLALDEEGLSMPFVQIFDFPFNADLFWNYVHKIIEHPKQFVFSAEMEWCFYEYLDFKRLNTNFKFFHPVHIFDNKSILVIGKDLSRLIYFKDYDGIIK